MFARLTLRPAEEPPDGLYNIWENVLVWGCWCSRYDLWGFLVHTEVLKDIAPKQAGQVHTGHSYSVRNHNSDLIR